MNRTKQSIRSCVPLACNSSLADRRSRHADKTYCEVRSFETSQGRDYWTRLGASVLYCHGSRLHLNRATRQAKPCLPETQTPAFENKIILSMGIIFGKSILLISLYTMSCGMWSTCSGSNAEEYEFKKQTMGSVFKTLFPIHMVARVNVDTHCSTVKLCTVY